MSFGSREIASGMSSAVNIELIKQSDSSLHISFNGFFFLKLCFLFSFTKTVITAV